MLPLPIEMYTIVRQVRSGSTPETPMCPINRKRKRLQHSLKILGKQSDIGIKIFSKVPSNGLPYTYKANSILVMKKDEQSPLRAEPTVNGDIPRCARSLVPIWRNTMSGRKRSTSPRSNWRTLAIIRPPTPCHSTKTKWVRFKLRS